jgi:hypothetical protein
MSATELAEYLVRRPELQEAVLNNARFVSSFVVSKYAEAVRPLRAYCCDPRRDQSRLESVKQDLRRRADDKEAKPGSREQARLCREAIELFERGRWRSG